MKNKMIKLIDILNEIIEETYGYNTEALTSKKLNIPGRLEEDIEGEEDLAPFDFEQDGNESRIGRDINNKKGWRRLSPDSSQNSSIKKYLDKYTSGYKWSNPPKSKRFPKENDIMYKTPYIMYVHLLQTSEGKNNIIDALNGMVANEPDNVMKQVLQALLFVFTDKEDQFKKIYEQYKDMIENNAKSDDGANPFTALKYAYENFSDKEGIFKKFKRNGWSSQQFMIKEDLITMSKPYTDIEVTDKYIIREFNENIDPIELLWHRDDEDRSVEILDVGQGWQFQYDEELPLDLKPTMSFNILRHQWHRVIKGEGKLVLKIQK